MGRLTVPGATGRSELLAPVLLGGGVLEVAVPVELGDPGAGHLAEVSPPVLEVCIAFLERLESV